MKDKENFESGKSGEETWNDILNKAEKEIHVYLDKKSKEGTLREELYRDAKKNVIPNIRKWVMDTHISHYSPNLRFGVRRAILAERWEDLTFAFLDDIAFGTGGIRGIAAFSEEELEEFAKKGIDAEILKGPNTINNIVLLLKSAGVADYAAEKDLKGIVIGYDSRIKGRAFAHLIAKTFLARGLTVYLFDEACPFPELTFAVPFLNADIGILISASHNDKRYNGYKLTSRTGAQFDLAERNYIYEKFIKTASTNEIELLDFDKAEEDKLVFLGGDSPLEDGEYYGRKLIDMHSQHLRHIQQFLDISLLEEFAPKVNVGYAAFHGSGRRAVPRLLRELNFENTKIISTLNRLDGMFPCFLLEQQPDPGDPVAAEIAVEEFKKEYGEETFENLDVLIGTDPDADRTGLVIKIPEEQRNAYREILEQPPHIKSSVEKKRSDFSWMLLDADTAWTILLWYQIEKEREKQNGSLPHSHKQFIVLNHTTTDALVYCAKKYGLGVVKTWVGFAMLSNAIDMVWKGMDLAKELKDWTESSDSKNHPILYDVISMRTEQRNTNIGAFEQSNGFSILGGPPLPGEKLGHNGHVRDKDGTFAAILLAELAAYATSKGTTIFNLIDEKIYLDPEIGCFVTYYEPIPYWGQFEGPTGMSTKINILRAADEMRQKVEDGDEIRIESKKVVSVEAYRTGKYDKLHRWEGFPDEGIRYFFDDRGLNHLTIRPSGTSQCLRLHVQMKAEDVSRTNLIGKKVEAYDLAKRIIGDVRKTIGALKK